MPDIADYALNGLRNKVHQKICLISFFISKTFMLIFKTPKGIFHAVKGVDIEINKGETVALVGESGSGKSVTAMSVMQLLPYPLASHPHESSVIFQGEELVGKSERDMWFYSGATNRNDFSGASQFS